MVHKFVAHVQMITDVFNVTINHIAQCVLQITI